MVSAFAREMKKKLREKMREGYHGWDDPDSFNPKAIMRALVDHVDKGDPVDVANVAAFLWNMEGG